MPDGALREMGLIAAHAGMLERARAWNLRERGLPLALAIDCAVFLVLLTAYAAARIAAPSWPRPFHFPSGLMTVAMFLFAFASSFVLRIAIRTQVEEGRQEQAMTQRMLVLAVVGWGTFLFLLAMEWARLYFFENVALFSNPWHVPGVGLSYYALSAFQAAHVLAGCVWLSLAAVHTRRWRISSLALYVDYTNSLFVVLAFFVVFSSADLGGF
jgi:heme/copper-type cytochrome/quinol oxidase subunit 3